jgi:hypothetical protein
MLPLEVFDR